MDVRRGARRAARRRPGRDRRLWIIGGVVVVAASLVAGSIWFVNRDRGSDPGPTPVVTPDYVPQSPVTPAGVQTWPLTGLTGPGESRPAVAVKVENSTEARPQIGLESADLVYEQMVEGGITRYIAVYHSQLPSQVVPVRSLRPMDGPILAPLHSVLAFSGGQARFIDRASGLGSQVISHDGGDAGFSRVSNRSAPHNVAGDVPIFLAQADANHQTPPPAVFSYARAGQSSSAQLNGQPASLLSIRISSAATPRWEWNVEQARWLRFEGTKAAVNAAGQQFGAANVVALTVEVRNEGGLDPAGNPIPESIVVGQGSGLLASGGAVQAITWSKADEAAPMSFRGADGRPIRLTPGNTWIELVPTAGEYTYQ
ncbi:MAG: DUF3048 domain-containing protein [Propionibacteriaceae bacterium]|jgi:hypothetical protein|nr:DUF3048 domain-containing protein [Propionibacteriaceae bacterium]